MSIRTSGRPRGAHDDLAARRRRRSGAATRSRRRRCRPPPAASGSSSSEPTSPAEALGQRAGAIGVAVGDEDRAHALVGQRLRRQLGGLAGADDDDRPRGEVADDFAGEVDGDRRDAHALAADPGLRAHALAGLQRGAEQAVRHRPGRAGGERGLVGALDLALDLALADDHRVEARGHAVELARRVAVARGVDDRGQLGRADLGAARQPAQQLGLGLHRVAADEVDLGAVAGRDRDGLVDLVAGDEVLQEALGPPLGERQALAQRDGRRLVRDAESEQLAQCECTASRPSSRSGIRSASSSSSASSRSKRASLVAMITT